MWINNPVLPHTDQPLRRKPIGDRSHPPSRPGQPLEGLLHLPLQMQAAIQNYLRTLQTDEVRRGRFVKVRIHAGAHQALHHHFLSAHPTGQIRHHSHCGTHRQRCPVCAQPPRTSA